MKNKHISYAFVAIAMSLALTSCQPEEIFIDVNLTLDYSEWTNHLAFQASISENYALGSLTRTALSTTLGVDGTYSLCWEKGDEISISDGQNTALFVTDGTTSTADFTKKSGAISNTASKYFAYYPSSLTAQNQKLPAAQEYVAGSVKNYPMYAESEDHDLAFKNLCGIFRLSLRNTDTEQPVSVKSVSVSADGMGMSGNFTIDESMAAVVSGTDGVVLSCASPVALGNEATDFNIIVPKGSYAGMKVKITTDDGKEINLVGESAVAINRSGITKVSVALKAADFENGLEVITFAESDVEFTER